MNAYRGKHVSSRSRRSVPSSFRRGRHQVRSRHRRRWLVFGLVLVILVFGYPLVEARLLQTETQSLQSDDLPAEIKDLRIVYLSDIHYGFWFSDGDLSRLVGRINSLRPDLVLFGGDYATDSQSAVRFFHALQKCGTIHSRYGIYGVLGDMDRGKTDAERNLVTEAMSNAGVIPLVNRAAAVNIASSQIWIAGLDDVLNGKPDVRSVARTVKARDYVILLCHNPSVIPDAQLATDFSGNLGWFDLGLFGHTHGGQMAFLASTLDIGQDVPERYLSGWLKENRSDLLISRGVGTSVFPGRFLCFPQIHCIEVSY